MSSMASRCGAVGTGVASDYVIARLTLQNLSDDIAANCSFNRVLHVGNVDAEAGCRVAIHDEVKIWLADHAKEAKIGHPADIGHDADDLIALVLELAKIRAVDLHGKFALHTGDRLVDVVGDGLREVPIHARNCCSCRFIAAISSSLF